ncbi:MAG: hypothetical protein AAF611_11230 [Bacteroidota bacterium]
MYLIWQLINILITLLILFLGVKFIINFKKHKLKTISYTAVTLVLLLISNFIQEENNEKIVLNTEEKTLTEASTDNKSLKLINTPLFDLNADIAFVAASNNTIPTEVISKLTGFSYGFDWDLQTVNIIPNEDKTYTYKITGNLDWCLFGLSFYTQAKEFSGTLVIE